MDSTYANLMALGGNGLADERAFQEKRRWPRFRVTMRAWLRVSRNGIEHAATGTCYDISEGGTRLFLASELHPGEELRMKLALPYGSPIEILGVVRNRNRYEYGVEFVDVNSEERANLLRNCTALALLM